VVSSDMGMGGGLAIIAFALHPRHLRLYASLVLVRVVEGRLMLVVVDVVCRIITAIKYGKRCGSFSGEYHNPPVLRHMKMGPRPQNI
jgi:hypothetical protein